MRPARSRRVQAQRKFAQGAYVPQNAAAAAPADNRRDAIQDPSNVTRNHMSAPNLLDVVSLHGPSSTPEKQGLHNPLTSQPVVLLERLRGRQHARVSSPQPSTSQRDPSQPRSIECQDARVSATSVEGPKLRTAKKVKEYKRVHAMSLRSRRLSKLKLNFIAESGASLRKVTFKRKRNSSDEDEPLIYQKNKNKKALQTKNSLKRTAESAPLVGILKHNPPVVTIPEQDVLKVPSNTTKQSVPKKQSAHIVPTPKQIAPKVNTPEKSSSSKKKQRRTSPPIKSLKVKCTRYRTPIQVTPQNKDSEPTPIPELVVSVTVKSEENANDCVDFDDNSAVNGDTSDDWCIPDVPDDPLDTDATLPHNELLLVGLPTESALDVEDARALCGIPATEDARASDVMHATAGEHALDETVAKQGMLAKEGALAIDGMMATEGTLDIEDMITTEDARAFILATEDEIAREDTFVKEDDLAIVPLATEGELAPDETVAKGGILANENEVAFDGFLATESKLNTDGSAADEAVISSDTIIPSLEQDNEPIEDDFLLHFDDNSEDERAVIDKVDNMAEHLDDTVLLEESVPCDPVVTSDVTLENAMKDPPRIRVVSPEPGPSGMQFQFSVYEKSPEAQDDYHSDTKIYLSNNIPEQYFREVFHRTAQNLEFERNRKLQKKTCVGASLRSDRDVINASNNEQVRFELRNDIMSSDSESSDSSIQQETTKRIKQHKCKVAQKKRLAKAKIMYQQVKAEKEKEIAALEALKQVEINRIMAEKNSCEAEKTRYQARFHLMQKEKETELARLKNEMRLKLLAEMEADRSMIAEVDGMARALENERDAKNMNSDKDYIENLDQPSTSGQGSAEAGVLVDAPVYHPTLEEFADPIKFYEKIWPEAVRFGICKIVPPPGWEPPEHKLDDDMNFDVTHQFISRLLSRWGPAARELCAIKLCLLRQKISIHRLPLVDGVEINLPKLYHMVQRHGGLQQVIDKKRWSKVVEDLNFTRGIGTEKKLDQIYVKYLLTYDMLSHEERHEMMAEVEAAWRKKHQKLFDRALNPLYHQKLLLGVQDEPEEETEDPDILEALNESEDCIIRGLRTTHTQFKKIATWMYESVFGQGSESAPPPDVKDIEEAYWRLVTFGAENTCVMSATIDTGEEGYGCVKNTSNSHPWHPKMVSQNRRNVLSYLDSIIGLTVPTLLLGMLYSTSCWHKDPHQIAWKEYQLVGAPRIWYAIGEDQAGDFRKGVEILCPTSAQNKRLWLPSDITMIPPDMLRQQNVTLSRLEQHPGEFVMVFPNAYTSCISTGYSVTESVYFAPPSWLKRLSAVFKETRESCEPTMFAMEHLLYNIARDPTADAEIATTAQPLFERMLHEEVTNRQMLQERGVTFIHQLQSDDAIPSTSSGIRREYSPREQEECEYCRATLFLSKVRGITEHNTLLCLEHALMFLDSVKYKDTDVRHVEVLVHVSVKELNTVNDDMKKRLGKQ